MKVILLQDVKKVGVKGAVADVSDGYAQNVLLPRKLAVSATAANIKQAEAEAARTAGKQATDETMARVTLAKLNGQVVTITAKAGETGTLFVAIRAKDVAEAIEKELKFTIPESAIFLDEPIKKTGDHPVPLSLMGANATLKVSARPRLS
jgi:large subunit ribosomal protein L9